jgi:HD domain
MADSVSEPIRLAELLAAISLATDLGRGFPHEKALRTCLVGSGSPRSSVWRSAREATPSTQPDPPSGVHVVHVRGGAGVRNERSQGHSRLASIVVQVHERWDGKGLPAGLGGGRIEPGARVISLASQVEIFHRIDGREETSAMLRRRSAGWLDPAAARAFERCAEDVFAALEAGSVWDAVLEAGPAPIVTIPERNVAAGALDPEAARAVCAVPGAMLRRGRGLVRCQGRAMRRPRSRRSCGRS